MGNNKKIFIIEDDHNMRNALKRLVKNDLSLVEILETDDGKEVLNIIGNSEPDLILLDVLMPGMNGLQVLKFLKENKNRKIKKIPVIMLTGVSNREIAIKAAKMGAVDYITKPINEKVFLKKIRNYLK